MVSGVLLIVCSIVLFFAGVCILAMPQNRGMPPWSIVHHGDTWTFVDAYGTVSSQRYSTKTDAEHARDQSKQFDWDYEHGLKQQIDTKKKAESAPGYWTVE